MTLNEFFNSKENYFWKHIEFTNKKLYRGMGKTEEVIYKISLSGFVRYGFEKKNGLIQ